MDDNEMIAELRRRAESKAMSKVLLAEMGISLELPSIITNAYPDMQPPGYKGRSLSIGDVVAVGSYEFFTPVAVGWRKLTNAERDAVLSGGSERKT